MLNKLIAIIILLDIISLSLTIYMELGQKTIFFHLVLLIIWVIVALKLIDNNRKNNISKKALDITVEYWNKFLQKEVGPISDLDSEDVDHMLKLFQIAKRNSKKINN
ncbi:MAG: hypothetical protein ACOC1K_01840 [Nanoarchaeota archaeon]